MMVNEHPVRPAYSHLLAVCKERQVMHLPIGRRAVADSRWQCAGSFRPIRWGGLLRFRESQNFYANESAKQRRGLTTCEIYEHE